MDLEGGWLDAGDFIKFTHTTAYADTLLFASERALGGSSPATLDPEARFGLRWLAKAWDPRAGVLALQVGIGSGNTAGTFNGDHDVWRLPQLDDALTGPANRYLTRRPAFRANDPGTPLPPNLAGRVTAAFALAAQVDAGRNLPRARRELDVAAAIFGAARDRQRPGSGCGHRAAARVLSREFLARRSGARRGRAGARRPEAGDPRAGRWLKAGERWARAFLAREAGEDTLNLYDTSALAHADLRRALQAADAARPLQARLLGDLRAQLERGLKRVTGRPLRGRGDL